MSLNELESQLERCYDLFDDRHADLRADLLAKMASEPVASIDRQAHSRMTSGRLLRRTFALAACLLVAAFVVFSLPLGGTTQVYGLEGLPQRLANVRSIYLHSTLYNYRNTERGREAIKSPTQSYIERPGRYLIVDCGVMDGKTWHVYRMSDGKRYVQLDETDQTFTEGKEIPLAAEYFVERVIQQNVVSQILGGPSTVGYKKTRTEVLDGVKADVYERVTRIPNREIVERDLVWLDPATGFPLQVKNFSATGDGPEELDLVYDKIVIDEPPPAGLFELAPPSGYRVVHADRTPNEITGGDGSGVGSDDGSNALFNVRFAFNIDDRAALVCWSLFNDDRQPRETDLEGPLGRALKLAPISTIDNRQFGNYFLRVDPGVLPYFDEECHWRWSLVVPGRSNPSLGSGLLAFRIPVEEYGFGTTQTFMPLRLDRQRLAEWIEETQRLTLPKDAPAEEIFTLEEIEGLVGKFAE